MTTLLVTISLLLHGVTFLWIMTLLQKQQPYQSHDETKMKQEIEDLLVSYTAEMKEENERLLEEIKKEKGHTDYRHQEMGQNHLKKEEELKVIKTEIKEEANRSNPIKKVVLKRNSNSYEDYLPPVIQEDKESIYEQSDMSKVIALSKQGFTTDEIAKKLNLGKGEVELMLKFYL
jgi:hypothetical protein